MGLTWRTIRLRQVNESGTAEDYEAIKDSTGIVALCTSEKKKTNQ